MSKRGRRNRPSNNTKYSTKSSSPTALAQAVPSTDIILKVIQEVKDRSRKDIKKWRDAMQAAENAEDPRWYLIQDLFSDLLTDGHLGSVMGLRSDATLNHPFYITDMDGNKLDDITDFFQKRWFFDWLEYKQHATYFKYMVFEFDREEDKVIFNVIPRRNICPDLNRVYLEVAGDKFIDFTDEPNVVAIYDKSPFGIINDVVPNLIWKRNLLQANAEFSERFGMPLITAMTANRTDAPKIDKALRNLGEAGTGVLPKGSEIQVHALANAGNPEKVYLDPAKFHDNQVSKRFIGSTTMVDEGANRSQTQVHAETLDDKIARKDRMLTEFDVNDSLFPVLQNLGFPVDNTKMKFKFDETESLTLKEEWDITNEALSHFELDQEDLMKKFGLKIIGVKQNAGGGFSENFQ